MVVSDMLTVSMIAEQAAGQDCTNRNINVCQCMRHRDCKRHHDGERPQELPVEKDMNAPNRKIAAGTRDAEKLMS